MTEETTKEGLEDLLDEEGGELVSEEEEAEFNAGFGEDANSLSGYERVEPEEEEPEEKPEEKQQVTEQEVKPEVTEAPDPRDQMIADLETRLRKNEGKFGELNSKLIAMESAKKEDRGPNYPTKEQIKDAANSPDTLEDLKERFPVWSAEVEAQEASVMSKLGIMDIATKEDVEAALEERIKAQGYVSQEEFGAILQQETGKILRETEKTLIDFQFPGWRDTVKTDDFHGWLNKQEAPVRELYKSHSRADASKMLGMYNEYQEKQKVEKQKRDRLEDAIPATDGSRSAPDRSTSSEEDDFQAGFGS